MKKLTHCLLLVMLLCFETVISAQTACSASNYYTVSNFTTSYNASNGNLTLTFRYNRNSTTYQLPNSFRVQIGTASIPFNSTTGLYCAPTNINFTGSVPGGTLRHNQSYSLTQGVNTTITLVINLCHFPPGSHKVTLRVGKTAYGHSPFVLSNTFTVPNLTISTTVTNSTCGNSNGSIVISGTGTCSPQYRINGVTWTTGNTFSGLAAGTYTCYIRNSANTSVITSTTATITTTTVPAAATNFVASNGNCGSCTLSWTASVGATSYRIYRGGTYLKTVTGTSDIDYSAPTSAIPYYVIARNSCGDAPASNSNTGWQTAIPASCNAPTGLTATTTTNSALVSWSSVVNAISYVLYYRLNGVGSYTALSVSGTSYNLTGLIPGTTYQYYVEALCGCGVVSNVSTLRTLTTLLSLTVTGFNSIPTVGLANETVFNFSCQVQGGVYGLPINTYLEFTDFQTSFPMTTPNIINMSFENRTLSTTGRRTFRYKAVQGTIVAYSASFNLEVLFNCNTLLQTQLQMIPRNEWCADDVCKDKTHERKNSKINYIIVHHSAGNNTMPNGGWINAVRSIYNGHKGLSGDVPYHYLIAPDGTIFEGRAGGPDIRGAHTGGNAGNDGSIGVCLIGDFTSQNPTNAAIESLSLLCTYLCQVYQIDPLGVYPKKDYHDPSSHTTTALFNINNIEGHRIYGAKPPTCSSVACATACPGNTFFPNFGYLVRERVSLCTGIVNKTRFSLQLLSSRVKNGKVFRIKNGQAKIHGKSDLNGFVFCHFYPELIVNDTLLVIAEGYDTINIVMTPELLSVGHVTVPLFNSLSSRVVNPSLKILTTTGASITTDTSITIAVSAENSILYQYLLDTVWVNTPNDSFSYSLSQPIGDVEGELGDMRVVSVRCIGLADTVVLQHSIRLISPQNPQYQVNILNSQKGVDCYIDGVFDRTLGLGINTFSIPKYQSSFQFLKVGYEHKLINADSDTFIVLTLTPKANTNLNKTASFSTLNNVQMVDNSFCVKYSGNNTLVISRYTDTATVLLGYTHLSQKFVLEKLYNTDTSKIAVSLHLDDTIDYTNKNYYILIEKNGIQKFISVLEFGDSIVFHPEDQILKIFGLEGGEKIAVVEMIIDLPIELLAFSAVRKNISQVSLDWATASESQNMGFDVERMLESETEFTKIAWVNGNGTTTATNYYLHIDENTYNGVSYYRLKQVDFDGTYSYSEQKAVSGIGQKAVITIYPNPVDDRLNISFGELDGAAKVVILNAQGQIVYNETKSVTPYKILTIDKFTDLASGVYAITVTLNVQTHTEKVIKR